MTTSQTQNPIAATENEKPALHDIEQLLANDAPLKIKDSQGTEVSIPASVFQVLQQTIAHLEHGHSITIVPFHNDLTTQEGADILNISRPYLIRLLEAGTIPYTKIGRHRRMRFEDVMRYKQQRDKERAEALERLTQLSQEYGLYDED